MYLAPVGRDARAIEGAGAAAEPQRGLAAAGHLCQSRRALRTRGLGRRGVCAYVEFFLTMIEPFSMTWRALLLLGLWVRLFVG